MLNRYFFILSLIGLIVWANYAASISQYGQITSLTLLTSIILPVATTLVPFITNELRSKEQEKNNNLTKLTNTLSHIPGNVFEESNLSEKELSHIRVNIMIPMKIYPMSENEKKLKIICGYNMDADAHHREKELFWSEGEGACGEAWHKVNSNDKLERKVPVVYIGSKVTDQELRDKWMLSEDKINRTAHIKWVISAPIMHISKRTGKEEFVGILSVDGTKDLKNDEVIFDLKVNARCKEWGLSLGQSIEDNNLLKWAKGGWPIIRP